VNSGRWVSKKLGDIFDIERGGSPRPIESFLTDANDGVNWIKIGDTKNVTKYITRTQEKIKPEGARRSRMVHDGDFILSNSMSFGRPYIMRTSGCIHDGWLVLREREPNINQDYLFHVLGSDLVFEQFDRLAAGSTVRNLNISLVQRVVIPLPPLPQQERIAAKLNDAFDSIAAAKASAEKNVQNARAVFKAHLESAFSRSGCGWGPSVSLSSILCVQPQNGWSPPADHHAREGTPVLTLSSVTGFNYNGSRVKFTSALTRDKSHYWLSPGELLITRSNTRELVGHVAIYDGTPPRAICCDLIMKMQVDPSRALTRFVYFYLRSSAARSYFTSRAHGASSTMKKIGKQVVQNIPVPLPSVARQQAAVEQIDSVLEETQRLESLYRQKLAALDALKKSLLHQAFTGNL
jgi:type I restriction enzyme, S subunit